LAPIHSLSLRMSPRLADIPDDKFCLYGYCICLFLCFAPALHCFCSGSERIARSGAEGDRLKEAININKSLSCLTDVFNGLAQKQAFVPFRNSKLTYFLQNALSGDGKTMMFVNLSPTHESYFESLCSLRFANGVNKIELGKASRNVTEAATEVNKKGAGGGKSKKAGDDKSPAPAKGKKK